MRKHETSSIYPAVTIAIVSFIFFITGNASFLNCENLMNSPLKTIASAFSQDEQKEAKPLKKPKYVRGIHVTPWTAGSTKARARLNILFDETEINTLVVAIKEVKGEVHIPGVPEVEALGAYKRAMPGIEDYLATLQEKNIYTIARICVFKDDLLAKKKPEWAVKNSSGTVWEDYAGLSWADPFNKNVWDYNLAIAKRAVELGFDEIQFDYIRFPSDGRISECRYKQAFTSTSAVGILADFLKEASSVFKPMGVNVSIDVFGLVTTNPHHMGIGQKLEELTAEVDFVSPMVYPSHYLKNCYNIPNPNKSPYETVYISMHGAKKRLGADYVKLRPFLQDFSLGHKYGPEEVRAQIEACYDNDVAEWILWDPWCRYTREALKGPEFAFSYEKSDRPDPMEIYLSTTTKINTVNKSTTTINTPADINESTTTTK